MTRGSTIFFLLFLCLWVVSMIHNRQIKSLSSVMLGLKSEVKLADRRHEYLLFLVKKMEADFERLGLNDDNKKP